MTRHSPDTLERLHRLYSHGVFRFFWMATRSREEAEDLLQEFFIKLARTRAKCRNPEKERAWIFSAARHFSIDWHRKHKRRSFEHNLEEIEFEPASPEENPDCSILAHQLLLALDTLPDCQREAATLRLWEELSLAEIAEIQKVPLQTVASRLRYATKRLRHQLSTIYAEIQ